MITRQQIMKFIPEPKNEDVIIYNIDLKNLINVNVLEEYNKLLPEYLNLKEKYNIVFNENKEYSNTIDTIYLFNRSWSEEDYLFKLKNDKKTYATLYGEIKKNEDKIKILKQKLSVMNEKINLQLAKENNEILNKKERIDKDIENNKTKLISSREKLASYTIILETINKSISENEEEFAILLDMQENLKTGNYKCKYCGSQVKVYSENSLIYKRLEKNIIENKKDLEKLLDKKNKIELEVAYYNDEVSTIKSNLNNDIEFKKRDYNFYQKKSLEVLKLEALRDELINNISEVEKTIRSKSGASSEKYKKIKEEIELCELSLTNLRKLKEIKANMQSKIEAQKDLKRDLEQIENKMKEYVKFLNIYFKIYEQKINNFFGENYKFKLFNFEGAILHQILKIQYKGIDYTELNEKDKFEVDKELALKISLFD